MNDLSAEEVLEWLTNCNVSKEKLHVGCYVSSVVRRKLMISTQNRIASHGIVKSIQWEDLKGGVWRCFLTYQ